MKSFEFKDQVLGLLNSSRSGPAKVGQIFINPFIMNFQNTLNDLIEVKSFVSSKIFSSIVSQIEVGLKERKKENTWKKIEEILKQ